MIKINKQAIYNKLDDILDRLDNLGKELNIMKYVLIYTAVLLTLTAILAISGVIIW